VVPLRSGLSPELPARPAVFEPSGAPHVQQHRCQQEETGQSSRTSS